MFQGSTHPQLKSGPLVRDPSHCTSLSLAPKLRSQPSLNIFLSWMIQFEWTESYTQNKLRALCFNYSSGCLMKWFATCWFPVSGWDPLPHFNACFVIQFFFLDEPHTPRWPVMFCVRQKQVIINSSLMEVTIFIYFIIEITIGYVICCYWSSRHWKYESEVDKDTSYWYSPTDRKTDYQDELNLVQLNKRNKGLREAYFEGWGNFLFTYIFFVSFFLKIITCPVVLGDIYVFWSVDNFWRIIIENEKGSLRCPSWISSF